MFAYPLVFSYQHRYFGDTRLATTLYPGITAYADFLKRMGDSGTGKTKGLVTWKKYGDWLEPGRVPSLEIIGEMSSGFNYGQTLRIARDTATTLGHTADAAKYDAAHTVLQKVFPRCEIYECDENVTGGRGRVNALRRSSKFKIYDKTCRDKE